MKARSIQFFSFLLFFLLLANVSYTQDSMLKEKFQEMNNQMIEDILSGNEEAAISMYADDAISLPSYEPMLVGKQAIMESHKKGQEAGVKMNDMTLTTMDVWSSGDMAYEIGTYTIDISIPQMGNMTDRGKYLTVWEKQSDGSWKVKADTWNTDVNPWEEMGMQDDMEGE
jgi:ketosteroid isomerase-like protein